MILRFGYVSNALSLWEASPSRTLTFTNWKKLDSIQRRDKLYSATEQNLKNTKRAIYYNMAHGIYLYRMSSSLVPLATHPEAKWDYLKVFGSAFREVGDLIQKNAMRVSFHPNQYTLFTSPRDSVTQNAILDITYHYQMLEAMGLQHQANLNIHIGGMYDNRSKALQRFYRNIKKLDRSILKQMTFENDDKTYTAEETLRVCEHLSLPFVFDYHHHWANPGQHTIDELLPRIYATWAKNTMEVPKFHLSSPRTEKQYRTHADYVDVDFALHFIKKLIAFGEDADIMIEAKAKDKAALRLVEELSSLRKLKRIDGGIIKI